MIPARIYDQHISYIHTASETWLREISREDFNSPEDVAASFAPTPAQPAAKEPEPAWINTYSID